MVQTEVDDKCHAFHINHVPHTLAPSPIITKQVDQVVEDSPFALMAMENPTLCGDFCKIITDLESENLVANVAAMNHASALIAGGKFPEPLLLCRLIAGFSTNLAKPHHGITVKRGVHSALKTIRAAITSNHMNMDSSVCIGALHAINCCFMDEYLRLIQHRSSMVRLWTVQDQLIAVRTICIFFRRSPVNINDTRCVRAFASLMLSPHTIVLNACALVLLSLPPIVPGFAFAITRAYCKILTVLPPQSSLQIITAVGMLDRLKQISKTMVDHPGFDTLAMDVLGALVNRNVSVQKKVLNLAMNLLTAGNVGVVLQLLEDELCKAPTADIPNEYQQMLEEAIRKCYSAYPESILGFGPKYLVFINSIRYIKDIMGQNPLLRAQLLKGLLRALRHVRSSPVCAAAVWAISVCSESLLEVRGTIVAISCLFKDLLYRRQIEKQILGGELEHEYMLPSNYFGLTGGDAQGEHQQTWLREMEELLFIHIGLTPQADGSYAIASSSKGSASSEGESLFIPPLGYTDNLVFLVHSGDALLADFVDKMLSKLVEKAEEYE